jgi:hypothetical protein
MGTDRNRAVAHLAALECATRGGQNRALRSHFGQGAQHGASKTGLNWAGQCEPTGADGGRGVPATGKVVNNRTVFGQIGWFSKTSYTTRGPKAPESVP